MDSRSARFSRSSRGLPALRLPALLRR